MATYPKHINHELSPMACPVDLDTVDLFGDGAEEHWYESYEILHREAPVLRIEGGGLTPVPMRSCSPSMPTLPAWSRIPSGSRA